MTVGLEPVMCVMNLCGICPGDGFQRRWHFHQICARAAGGKSSNFILKACPRRRLFAHNRSGPAMLIPNFVTKWLVFVVFLYLRRLRYWRSMFIRFEDGTIGLGRRSKVLKAEDLPPRYRYRNHGPSANFSSSFHSQSEHMRPTKILS